MKYKRRFHEDSDVFLTPHIKPNKAHHKPKRKKQGNTPNEGKTYINPLIKLT